MRALNSLRIALLTCALLSSTSLAGATPQKNDEMLANEIAKQVRN